MVNIDLNEIANDYRNKLMRGAKYLLLFEWAKNKIVNTVRNFFADISTIRFENNRIISNETEEYKIEVIKPKEATKGKDKRHRLVDTLHWAVSLGFNANLEKLEEIINHRNYIAHELDNILDDNNFIIKTKELSEELIQISAKFERWWLVNFEDLTNSITEKDISTTSIGMIATLIEFEQHI